MSKYGLNPDRRTFYSHKKHVLEPDPAFQAVIPAPKKDLRITKSSNTEFLEEIRDTALAKVRADPASVTVEQGLKAASILEGRKNTQVDQINLLVQVVTGNAGSVYTIDGEAKEVD